MRNDNDLKIAATVNVTALTHCGLPGMQAGDALDNPCDSLQRALSLTTEEKVRKSTPRKHPNPGQVRWANLARDRPARPRSLPLVRKLRL